MTSDDISGIERALNLKLPEAYRAMVCSEEMRSRYEGSDARWGLLFDRKLIEEENLLYREIPVACDYWDCSWLAIHADGMGNAYFIKTDPYDERIYDFDHEQTLPGYDATESAAFSSMNDFLAYLDAEITSEKTSSVGSQKRPVLERVFRFFGAQAGG